MPVIIGVIIICVVLSFAMWLSYQRRITAGGFFGVVVVGILAGAVTAGLPRIISVAMKAGTTTSVDIKLQEVKEAAQQVQTDANEVRQMKEQIETLVKRVEQGEQNVLVMQGNVRQAYQSLFESIAYIILTRNIFPPPPAVAKEMDRHVNLLGTFAYPDEKERSAVISKLMETAHGKKEGQ